MAERTTAYYRNYKRSDSGRSTRVDFKTEFRTGFHTDFRTDKRNIEQKNLEQNKLTSGGSLCRKHRSGIVHRSWDRRKICLFVALSLFLLSGGIGICSVAMASGGSSVVEANHQLSDVKYMVVEIQHGDSLWSIAKEYMTPGFSDIYEYIDEIKRCNQLDSDHITSGSYLMIPYYEDLSL